MSDILKNLSVEGWISAAQSEQLQKSQAKTADTIMIDLLSAAQTLARPPISGFSVGAVVRGSSGALYLGANLEVPGQSLGSTVHAEQAAAANAYMHSEEGIVAIAVTAAPCGHCRQFLEELSPGGKLRVLTKGQRPVALRSLLPSAFGPADLGFKQGALPVGRTQIALINSSPDAMLAAALSAARVAYAPYTKAHSGVALKLSDGTIHSGAYIENAAFNPSLSPLQVALCSVVNAHRNFEEINEAVLVELKDAPISQKSATESVLKSIGPHVQLQVSLGSRTA